MSEGMTTPADLADLLSSMSRRLNELTDEWAMTDRIPHDVVGEMFWLRAQTECALEKAQELMVRYPIGWYRAVKR